MELIDRSHGLPLILRNILEALALHITFILPAFFLHIFVLLGSLVVVVGIYLVDGFDLGLTPLLGHLALGLIHRSLLLQLLLLLVPVVLPLQNRLLNI